MSHVQALPSGVIPPKLPSPSLSPALSRDEGPGYVFQIPNPASRNREFFLRDALIAHGGVKTPTYNPSLAYFCKTCGHVWGRVTLGTGGWHAVSIPCSSHGGGSYLKPLIWWDYLNGRTLAQQLRSLPEPVLRHEVKVRLLPTWNGGQIV